ncbi:MAG: right-handed parallel beta-helix repeat-containing protein, partial [Ilumatobacteraceae bacterium]|nr:right-handed parallel beta-helix repeat-containing protein [Ilumatobacteraceae bacterium]
ALSEPGEWYLDRPRGRLTYLPLPGETPEHVTVVAPHLAEIVRFQGSTTAAVADVVLEYLGFEHNEWSRPSSSCGTVQAAFDVPGAVVFERAERCVLYGCSLAHVAGYGVEILTGSHANVVAASTIRDLGAGAVKIGHENLTVHSAEVGTPSVTDPRWLRPQSATIADCHLYDGGHIYPSAVGVWVGNAGQNRIQHNHIHHFAYTGISCGWNWGYAPTRAWDNRIEFNHIHHINHLKVLSDNGGIYTLGVQPGSSITGNHVHDVSSYHYGGQGIYPDEGSSGIRIENNCTHRVAYYGMSVHYGVDLVVRNNLLVVMGEGVLDAGRVELSCGMKLERNLMVWLDCPRLKSTADWLPEHWQTRNNLVWCDAPGGVPWFRGSLTAEQAAGRWRGTIEADPLFADARSGDFALRADSPALKLGFKPFDWRVAGVRPRVKQAASWKAYRLPVAKPKAVAVAQLKAGTLIIDGDTAVMPLRVTLANPSLGRVRGKWTVRMADGSVAKVETGAKLQADLAPGASVTQELRVHLRAAHGRQWVQVVGDGVTTFTAAVPAMLPLAVTMPRQAAEPKHAVSRGLEVNLDHAGVAVLRGHAAVVDDHIAIDLTVSESTLRVDRKLPWQGSSLEIFADAEPTPGVPVVPKQWMLLPPDAQGAAEIRSVHGQAPDPTTWRIELVPGGWRARMRIPLAELGLPPTAKAFRFDVIVTAMSPV